MTGQSKLTQFGLRVVAIAAFAFAAGMGFTKPAAAEGTCGDDSECYSVPDGCGTGVGCVTSNCTDVNCVSPINDTTPCHYCNSAS